MPQLSGRFAAVLVASALVASAQPVAAQESRASVTLDRYRAAETPEDGFAISRPDDMGHLRVGAHLHLDYAYNPLVWEGEQGDLSTQDESVVAHHLVGTVGLALGVVNRVVVFAGLPLTLVMTGDDNPSAWSAQGFGLGDLYLGGRVRIIGDNDSFFSLGFQATLTAPTARAADETQAFAGEQNFTGHPEVLLELRPGDFRLTANVGARFRDGADFDTFGSGHEITYGLGATYDVIPMLDVLAELYGSYNFTDHGAREAANMELIAGARIYPGAGVSVGLAGGLGLMRGAGTPAARAVLTVGWAMRAPSPEDLDGDGILNEEDQCPNDPEDFDEFEDENGCPDPDNDDDGVLDDDDECPNEPEDVDEFEDDNGCPDPDNDQDGVLDASDECPTEPEDIDEFEDENGCPDPDNDQDGVLDASDECPTEPEDTDNFEDDDGCPDPDNDQDTVLDGDDECPTAPGSPDNNGCPVAVRVTGSQIVILQRIEFATDSDRILGRSIPIVQEVQSVLAANPQIRRVRIEGHTDDRGREAHNLDLSRRRAISVMRWLTEHGIDATRLEAEGFGESRPIETNSTRAGRQANRRVEFHITDPAPPAAE